MEVRARCGTVPDRSTLSSCLASTDEPLASDNTEDKLCFGTLPDRSTYISALACLDRPPASDQDDLMETLLRREKAAAADVTPVSWSVADFLKKQLGHRGKSRASSE